ncbi:MAG: hypothetical protein HKN68_15460 [Saprospiraceae bacterium]|nr:hypothetical protein [Saprospiraceae bacterium]
MTLGQFLDLLAQNPTVPLFFYVALPLTAFLASVFGKGEGAESPWNYMYTIVVYLACVPGIFAITLNVYLFLFERQSIMDTDLFTQILPIVCMILTMWLVRRNVEFDDIPGFDKLSGLFIIITALITLMWICEKTRIFAITIIPFHYFLILFIILIVGFTYGWKRVKG